MAVDRDAHERTSHRYINMWRGLDVAQEPQGWKQAGKQAGRGHTSLSQVIRTSDDLITQFKTKKKETKGSSALRFMVTFKSEEQGNNVGHLLQQSVPRPTLAGFEAIHSAGRRSAEHSSLPTYTIRGEDKRGDLSLPTAKNEHVECGSVSRLVKSVS